MGTFVGLWVLGFTINQLSLFGMVLAIGIVVDDAIIVIENAERIMTEEGLSPKDATIKAMGQISGAVVAVTVVLAAVFVPSAFQAGSAGRSEEHTSELQSLMRISYAVFCLKKKNLHYNQQSP